MRLLFVIVAFAAGGALVACASDAVIAGVEPGASTPQVDASSPTDAGATVDAETDASVDAASDAGVDAADAGGPETVVSVTPGRWQTCFVMSTGRVFCSGIDTNTPKVVPGVTDAVELVFGSQGEARSDLSHTCIRRKAGTVACWGSNVVGQLGDGTTTAKSGIVDVVGLATVVQLSGGPARNTCARLAGGTVRCWGSNDLGWLGDGTMIDSPSPTSVSGLTNAGRVSGTCAIRTSGQVVCWGGNDYGSLGDGTFAHSTCIRGGSLYDCSLTPVNVSGLSDAKAISAASLTTFAIRNDGTVWSWGRGATGALGDGQTSHTACSGGDCAPVPIAVGLTADQVGASPNGGCARLGGSAKCWGGSDNGRLGNGEFVSTPSPVDVFNMTNAVSLAAGYNSVCATRATGVISCWGRNEGGSLGIGTYAQAIGYPMNVVPAW